MTTATDEKEIKFRAWDIANKKMGEVITLYLSEGCVVSTAHEYRRAFPTEAILMQYTGLHDKNGKEIYEGDIVDMELGLYGIDVRARKRGRIHWQEAGFVLVIQQDGHEAAVPLSNVHSFQEPSNWQPHHSEIIGNIYENPELLHEKN